MTIGEWLSFRGRIGRRTYWLGYVVPLLIASIIAGILDAGFGFVPSDDGMPTDMSRIGVFSGIVFLLSLWPSLAGGIKRLHDRDRSGWWIGGFYLLAFAIGVTGEMAAMAAAQGSTGAASVVLIGLILLAGYFIWLFVEMGFLRGTPGPNRFGPDPLAGQGAPPWPHGAPSWQPGPQPGWGPPPGWQQSPPQQPPGWQPPPPQQWQAQPQQWQPPPSPQWPPPGAQGGPPPPGYGQPPQPPPQWGGGSVPPVRRD